MSAANVLVGLLTLLVIAGIWLGATLDIGIENVFRVDISGGLLSTVCDPRDSTVRKWGR